MRLARWLTWVALVGTAASHSPTVLRPQDKASSQALRFDAQLLALAPGEVEAEHALALLEARSGNLEAALERLEKLLVRAEIGEHKPLVEREVARIKAFTRLRDAHLAELVKSGSKLAFEHQGKKVVAQVTGVVDGNALLADNKHKLASVPIFALDPFELARGMSPTLTAGADGWARYYMYVLAGDERGVKQLKGAATEVTELRADAAQWYPRALKLGAVAQRLAALAEKGEPHDAQAAAECLAVLVALGQEHGELDLIKTRKATLAALAALALAQQFEPSKMAAMVAGKLESLPGERVRVTYEFERKEEADDFAADHGYLSSFRRQMGSLDSAERKCEVASGKLSLVGAGCLRYVLSFEAPLSLQYEITLGGGGGGESRDTFIVGACDDRDESRIDCQGFGSLWVEDRASSFRKQSPQTEPFSFQPGKPNTIGLSIDAGKASSTVNGAPMKTVEIGPRTSGGVFVFFHCATPMGFNKLVIEGKPMLDAARATWIERELARLGF